MKKQLKVEAVFLVVQEYTKTQGGVTLKELLKRFPESSARGMYASLGYLKTAEQITSTRNNPRSYAAMPEKLDMYKVRKLWKERYSESARGQAVPKLMKKIKALEPEARKDLITQLRNGGYLED